MRECKNCGVDINDRGNRAIRCISCQRIFRDIGSGRANQRYYQLWKFLNENDFTREELQILFLKRKKDCKRADFETRKVLRTEMLIISKRSKRLTRDEK